MAPTNSFNNTLISPKMQFGGDATGDVYFLGADGRLTRLGLGAAGLSLVSDGTTPQWSVPTPGGNASGDLTGSYPAPSIANNAVTFAKFQQLPAQTLFGNLAGTAGNASALSVAQVQGLLGLGSSAYVETGTTAGTVPLLEVGGKLPSSVIPSLALTTVTVVADEATRLALTDVQTGDVAKQSDTGVSYMLAGLPASDDANWVRIGDSQIDAADLVSGVIATARLGTGTANTSTFLRGDQTWASIATEGHLPYTEVTLAAQSAVGNRSYGANSNSRIVFTLPTTAVVGAEIEVVGIGTGGWRLAQGADQIIHFGDMSTTTGITGRLDSMHRRDSVKIKCVVADLEWTVIAAVGNIDVL